MVTAEASDVLKRHVLDPLVGRCADDAYGGFLVDFDDRWRPVGPHDKSLEHAARTTLAFALLDRALPGAGCDVLARRGCAFLREAMWDDEYGGFYARVDRRGKPLWDGLKHPHAATYVACAFRLAADILPPGEGTIWAARAQDWLDEVAWDGLHGGYWGCYRRNNDPYPEGARLPTPDGLDTLGLSVGYKEVNTQGDAVEMLAMGAIDGAPRAQERFEWMVDLVTGRLVDPYGVMPYAYRRDWRPAPCLVRVGYLFQMARRLALAPPVPGDGPGPLTTSCRLVDFGLKAARHPDGGYVCATTAGGRTWPDTGPSSDTRQWWAQFEALYAFEVLSRHPSLPPEVRARYRLERDRQWAFVRDNYFDERFGGIREAPVGDGRRALSLASLPRLGRRSPSAQIRKSHAWKDIYHEVVALLALSVDEGPPRPDARRS